MKIYQTLAALMPLVRSVGKDHKNTQQNFKYRSYEDFYNMLQPLMAEKGLFTVPEVLNERRDTVTSKSGTVQNRTVLRVKYTIYCDDGSKIEGIVEGEGMDSGDKSTSKAMTMAHKYFIVQLFMIPLETEKDPDGESPMYEPPPKHSAPAKSPTPQPTLKKPFVVASGKHQGKTLSQVPVEWLRANYKTMHERALSIASEGKKVDPRTAQFLREAKEILDVVQVPNTVDEKSEPGEPDQSQSSTSETSDDPGEDFIDDPPAALHPEFNPPKVDTPKQDDRSVIATPEQVRQLIAKANQRGWTLSTLEYYLKEAHQCSTTFCLKKAVDLTSRHLDTLPLKK